MSRLAGEGRAFSCVLLHCFSKNRCVADLNILGQSLGFGRGDSIQNAPSHSGAVEMPGLIDIGLDTRVARHENQISYLG